MESSTFSVSRALTRHSLSTTRTIAEKYEDFGPLNKSTVSLYGNFSAIKDDYIIC